MKKIYNTYIEQTFKWREKCFLSKKKEYTETVTGNECLILAESIEDAIQKYSKRYKTNLDDVVDIWWNFLYRNSIKCYDFVNEVKACQVMRTFNYLKENMRADEFLEYCKQELYPIGVVINKGGIY